MSPLSARIHTFSSANAGGGSSVWWYQQVVARALEAYPIDKVERGAHAWLWNGGMSMYTKAGFVEMAGRRPERPVVRLMLSGDCSGVAL